MRKKRSAYNKVKAVKSVARERVGSPPPSRSLVEKKHTAKPKHKKSIDPSSE